MSTERRFHASRLGQSASAGWLLVQRIVAIVVFGVLGAAVGCGRSSAGTDSAPRAHPMQSPEGHVALASDAQGDQAAENDYRHDAGKVLAGTALSHAFTFENRSPGPIRIARDEDIAKNCGCTIVRAEARELLPGESTRVFVEMGTAGQSGPLRKGGQITWTLESRERRTVTFQIQADVTQPFAAEPEMLTFNDDEVRAGTIKTVALTSAIDVDWATLSATSPSTSFQIVKAEATQSGGRVAVRCSLPQDLDDDSGHILVSAQPRAASTGGADAPPSLSVQIRARASRTIDLAIAPRPLMVRFDKKTGKGSARCLLRGAKLESLADDKLIESINCPGFTVQWSVQGRRPKSRLAVLELSLLWADQVAIVKDHTLTVTVPGNNALNVPLLLVE